MGARARAMVVTDGVDRAIAYYLAISQYIQEKGLPFRAIIAWRPTQLSMAEACWATGAVDVQRRRPL